MKGLIFIIAVFSFTVERNRDVLVVREDCQKILLQFLNKNRQMLNSGAHYLGSFP